MYHCNTVLYIPCSFSNVMIPLLLLFSSCYLTPKWPTPWDPCLSLKSGWGGSPICGRPQKCGWPQIWLWFSESKASQENQYCGLTAYVRIILIVPMDRGNIRVSPAMTTSSLALRKVGKTQSQSQDFSVFANLSVFKPNC